LFDVSVNHSKGDERVEEEEIDVGTVSCENIGPQVCIGELTIEC
jgi:hypothetical protein